jgi:ubiquinone/menaquinone biosynthesis C-methylase UbiE
VTRKLQPRGIDNKKLTRWYNAQARFYSARRDDFEGGHVRGVADSLDPSQPQTILDAGCGTGLFTVGLAGSTPQWNVVGVDAADGMLEVGRRRATGRGLTNTSFHVGNVEQLDFEDATFDAVVAAGLLPNLNSPGPALLEFYRVLKPASRLFVVEIDREALSFLERTHFRLMVWGYRAISTVLPRFKFAHGWSLERSTLDVAEIEAALEVAAFRVHSIQRESGHLIVEARKPQR